MENSRNVCGVKHGRFETNTAVVTKIQIFWDVTSYYALVTGKWHDIPEDLNILSLRLFSQNNQK